MPKRPAQFTEEDNQALEKKLKLRKALNKEENQGLLTAKDRQQLEKDVGKLYEKRNKHNIQATAELEKGEKVLEQGNKALDTGIDLTKKLAKMGKSAAVGAANLNAQMEGVADVSGTAVDFQTDISSLLIEQIDN